MLPLYLTRIEDLRHGDLVKVDCAAAARAEPLSQGSRLKDAGSMPRMRSDGRAVISIKWRAPGRVSRVRPTGMDRQGGSTGGVRRYPPTLPYARTWTRRKRPSVGDFTPR
jgi:hypothetical protein